MITPDIRARWRIYSRCRRTAAALRAGRHEGRGPMASVDCAAIERAARAWAAPFAHRLETVEAGPPMELERVA